MKRQHKVHIARGLFENSQSMLRIGHFGNVTPIEAERTLEALKGSMLGFGCDVQSGMATEAARPLFAKLNKKVRRTLQISPPIGRP